MTRELNLYLAILRKRLWMIVLLFAITMTVILISALSAKPTYESAVRLQIVPTEPEQVALYGPASSTTQSDLQLIAYQFGQIVRGSKAAGQTISQLGLDMSRDELIRRISTYYEYGFITVVASADSPQLASAIVTAQVENALTLYRADQSRPAVVQGEFISGQLAEAEQAYAKAEADLLRFKLSHTISSLEQELSAYQALIRDLRSRRENAVLTAAELAARIQALSEEAQAAEQAADNAAAGSPQRDAALARAAELRRTVSMLRGDLAAQQAAQVEYDRTIARWETELTSLIGLSDEHTRLADTVTQARNTRNFLFNKSLEAQLKQRQGLSVGYLKIVDSASRPDRPLASNTPRIALIGGLLSIVLGVLLALVFEFIETLARQRGQQTGRA